MTRDVHTTQVGQLHIHVALCSPTAFVVVTLHTKLVHPHFYGVGATSVVSHTNHHRLDFAQRWITHHANLVVWTAFVVHGEELGVACFATQTCLVAFMLDVGQCLEVDINHVLYRPNSLTALSGVGVVSTFWRDSQWHFVFVVIALVIRTQTEECAHLEVFQTLIAFESIGVDEHLQMLVLAEVEVHGLIYTTCIARREVLNDNGERLLVFLSDLRLAWVCHTTDAWRQHVVDWSLVVVLLNIHSSCVDSSRHTWLLSREEWLCVVAPFTTHEVEAGKAHDDWLLEIREIHTHEANAREVVDGTLFLFVSIHRNAELIPSRFFRFVVTQFHIGLA